MAYRILSLDGGGQLEMTSTLLLQEIEKRRPGFLKHTDLIAGTSAGAWVGLILATKDDPTSLLPYTEKLWENFFPLVMNSLAGTVLGLFGLGALFQHERIEEFLGRPELLGTKTLGDLAKRVVITSFSLDDIDEDTGARCWKPKIFHNFRQPGNLDLQESAVRVALRSGAAPIMFPTVDGFVDGGVFANHPAMVAISKVIHDWRKGPLRARTMRPRAAHEYLPDLRVLSIGVGEDHQYVAAKNANLGYFNWVLNPFNPLLVINALLRGNTAGIDFECCNLLPEGNYHRLNPYYARNSLIPMMVDMSNIRATVASTDTQALVDKTVEWLDNSGWLENDDPDEEMPLAPGGGVVEH